MSIVDPSLRRLTLQPPPVVVGETDNTIFEIDIARSALCLKLTEKLFLLTCPSCQASEICCVKQYEAQGRASDGGRCRELG